MGLARTALRGLGMTALPIAIVSHPIGGLKLEDVLEKGDIIIEDVIRALTKKSENENRMAKATND